MMSLSEAKKIIWKFKDDFIKNTDIPVHCCQSPTREAIDKLLVYLYDHPEDVLKIKSEKIVSGQFEFLYNKKFVTLEI